MKLTEDDIYRKSSQYKHWSFTPTQLALLRQKTNVQACERVKANVARQRAQRAANALEGFNSASDSERANTPGENGSGNGTPSANGNGNGGDTPLRPDKEVDCLTVAEEMRLVDKFCETVLALAAFIGAPADVTATAIQFFRRFYLYNSPMTYDGQVVARTIMFVACKTDNFSITLDEYIAKVGVTRDQILAPEYLIVQALRFNFEVKHPFRGLRGVHLELGEMLSGSWMGMPFDERSKEQRKQQLLRLPKRAGGKEDNMTERDFGKRLEYVYGLASKILKETAQLTDAYFLYTPSQIMFAAQLLADEPVTMFYLNTHIPSPAIYPSSPYNKIIDTIRACALLLSSHHSYTASSVTPEEKAAKDKQANQEIKALLKKLKQCRDPDKIDLVKLNQAHKRDAVHAGELEESKAKRRKIAREDAEKQADDFWGAELHKK
ncbi:hypothetical protein P280DRAFT_471008 [Massarina eburnea CBS 473.64]|uniref:RNA polymerase II holoenzyme cyclin-like subunit n=1 Tax=Massarina eburnea CBS 473.64 TaxID=1395130 RepID=A0A6A6RUP0_9PLEO|nr:hypothetical protein P280DRAFT_471008 [Massarina eburnea CBS 473.64]